MKYLWILIVLSATSAFGQNSYGTDYLNLHCTAPDPNAPPNFGDQPRPGLVPSAAASGNAIVYCDAASGTLKTSFNGSAYSSLGSGSGLVNRASISFNCNGAPNCTQIFADGQNVVDATCTNTQPTCTCPNTDCNFTSNDAFGRPIMKNGQKIWATTSSNLSSSTFVCPVSTVSSFSAQSVTLSNNCTASGVANVALYWGDDDGPTLHGLALQCVNYQVPSGVYIMTSRGFMNTKPSCSTVGTATALNFPFAGLSAAAGNNTGFYITPDFNYADCTGSNGTITNICIGAGLGQIEKIFLFGTGITSASNANCANGANKTILSGGTQGMVIHNVVLAGICPGQSALVGIEISGADAIFDNGGSVDVGNIACQSDGANVFFSTNDCIEPDVAGNPIGLYVKSGILNDFESFAYGDATVNTGSVFNGHGTQFTSTNGNFALTVLTGATSTHDGDVFTCTIANTGCISETGTARVSLRNVTMNGASTNGAISNTAGSTLIDQGGNQVTGSGQVQTQIALPASSVMGDQVVTGVCQGTATAASTLGLYGAGELTTPTCTSTTVNLGVPMTRGGSLMGLGVTAGTGGVNASSGVVTVMKTTAGTTSATTLTCTLGTGTICHDSTHIVAYAIGDVISIQFTTQAAETLANVKANVLAW